VRGVRKQQARQEFASLWAVPGRGPESPVTIGIWNHNSPAIYTLRVRRGRRSIRDLRLRLGPYRRWQAQLSGAASAGQEPLLVTLYRNGAIYRSVELDTGAGS
jgi:hypothetical protein